MFPPKFVYFILFLLLGTSLLEAQPEVDYSLVERLDANGFREYFAYFRTQVEEEKDKAKETDQKLLEEWKKNSAEWKTNYKSSYPYPKPEKIKIKVVQSRISLQEAERLAQEMNLAEKQTYAVIKINNENGAMYEVMTENESVIEYLKEMKFHLKEWRRYYEKQRKKKPTKPYIYIMKRGFKTKEEAKQELLRLLEES